MININLVRLVNNMSQENGKLNMPKSTQYLITSLINLQIMTKIASFFFLSFSVLTRRKRSRCCLNPCATSWQE